MDYNSGNTAEQHAEPSGSSAAPPQIAKTENLNSPTPAPDAIPVWRRYVHLFLPLIVSPVLVFNAPAISQRLGLSAYDGGNTLGLVAFSAFPTYLLGSTVYPANRPQPTPEQSIRFTRKNDIYRVLVLLTYGRLFGTPFNVLFFIADLLFSFGADRIIGERPVGTPQRRSEFFVAALWVAGSWFVGSVFPPSTTIGFGVAMVDRTLWRTMYIALVDDVIGVLTQPNVSTWQGKFTLVAVQAFTIVSLNYLVLSWIRRLAAAAE